MTKIEKTPMPIINSIVNFLSTKRLKSIDEFRNKPFEAQESIIKNLIATAKDTEWGKLYDYDSIRSIEAFQQRVPFQDYNGLKPFIERVRQGEQNVIWPTPISWFAKSSGTTEDKSKFIPVSNESLNNIHYQGGKDTLTIYNYNYPDTQIFSGKGLTLGGSHQIDKVSGKTYSGDLSAILIENIPFWADLFRTPSQKVALIPDFEEKMRRIASEAIPENVTYFAGVPSWNMVLMKFILEQTGKSNLMEVWPNMELFIHGGVSFTPYREQYRRLFPSDAMNYMETYNASEGFFALQDDPKSSDMLLMLDYGIFYEFIPMDSFFDKSCQPVTVADVKTGVNYAVVITTNGGLWRYIIGDTVEFTSLYPHKIRITGRTKHFINTFGEELIVDNAEQAIHEACVKTGAIVSEYTAAPIYMNSDAKGAHEWLFEFEKEPSSLDLFTEALDQKLMQINSDYEAKRFKSITLEMPKVHSLKKGVFYEWLKQNGKLGGQNKVPRLYNNRDYIDKLLSINSTFQ